MMKELDSRYPVQSGTLASPLIFVNGDIFKMINPVAYFALLSVDKIFEEKNHQVAMAPYGAIEVTNIGARNHFTLNSD